MLGVNCPKGSRAGRYADILREATGEEWQYLFKVNGSSIGRQDFASWDNGFMPLPFLDVRSSWALFSLYLLRYALTRPSRPLI